ncbi:MAG: TonB-dependent siderophore receptor [Arcobacteraceae bacterium]
MSFKYSKVIVPALALALNLSVYAQESYTTNTKSLKEAIENIAKQANLPYIADGKLLENKTTKPITNITNLQNALDKLLFGSGLEAIIEENTIIVRKITLQSTLGTIDFVANSNEGTAQDGYLVKETSNIGPWKGKSLQDTPIAINVMSEDLIENLQAISTDQIYNINPVMQVYWNQSQNNNGYVMLRGFSTTTSAYDGMRREKWQFAHNTNIEEYERLETITGLSGFLYGPASIGGIMNYIPKRPTTVAQHSVTLGNAGGKRGYYVHADLSGPLTQDGKVGYRLNVTNQDNDTHVEHQHIKRSLVNLALDYKITDNLLIQGIISKSDYKLEGRQPYWYLASGATRPSASNIDSNKLWAQKWAYNEAEVTRYTTNLLWNISDTINLRAAYMNEKITREGLISANTIQTDGTYTQVTSNTSGSKQDMYGYGANAFFDFNFDTGNIKHQLTTGVQISNAYRDAQNVNQLNSKITLTGLTFNSPIYVDAPATAPITSTTKDQYNMTSTNFTFGDSIEFNPQWSLLVGASNVELEYKDNNYKKSAITPSVSLIYKPIENLSLYSSYMEGLELGGIAGDTYGGFDVVNAKAMMDPLMSEQIEVGAKLSLGDTLLTAALFQIDKGLEYYDLSDITKPKYVQDGRQVHKGVEFTATGKITDKLTTIAGVTFLDPQVKENKQNPLLEGKKPTNVADRFAKLYLEYSPFNDMELAFNTGINYTGSFYGDTMNTDKMPSYTLVNLGTRYTTKKTVYPLTIRLNVNNAFDKEYWVNSYYLGDRRTFHASVEMKF